MPIEMEITNAMALVLCDAVVDELDSTTGGTAQPNPECFIFTGAAPGSPNYADAADPAGKLIELALSNPAFNAAADQAPNAQASLNGSPSGNATATGTAASFRMKNRDTTQKVVWQGNVGVTASTNDLELNNTSINSGQTIQLTGWTVTMPEGPGT